MRTFSLSLLAALILTFALPAFAGPYENMAPQARKYRDNAPVLPQPDGNLLVEAEEFAVQGDGTSPGWRAMNWGENYYAATFANTFMSRKAFLGAPAQCDDTEATIEVQVPRAGRYLALVRYEAAYRFETQFKLVVEQSHQLKLSRLYGARKNLKVWAFNPPLKDDSAWASHLHNEVGWHWGAVENVVWEGTDAYVNLEAGTAKLTLIAGSQGEPAARRNVDCILLTTDEAQVRHRIATEGYLPLDGMLTQAGDVYLRLKNSGKYDTELTVNPGVQHSSYWVHQRTWKPAQVHAAPGQASDWVEVGSLLDTLNDGAWNLAAHISQKLPAGLLQPPSNPNLKKPSADDFLDYSVEIGARSADGKIESLRAFTSVKPALTLAYDANTRYTRRVRPIGEVLSDLLAYLKKNPVPGSAPKITPIYATVFDPRPDDPPYQVNRQDFIRTMGLSTTVGDADMPSTGPVVGYVDARGTNAVVEKELLDLKAKGQAPFVRTVSLGDEIGLPRPPADCHEAFRAWARAKGLQPSDVDPIAGSDWQSIRYPAPPAGDAHDAWARNNPRLYYYSTLFAGDYGIRKLKEQTDLVKQYLPHADAGANFSPHAGAPYLGNATQYITCFRDGGMTMPWGEDYAWQIPVGSQQMNFIQVDLFRAGNRYHPERSTQMYVMPHWPGNTLNSWRRLFYGDLGSGVKIINLFEFRPVQAAYTENHVSLPEMFNQVRRSLFELANFEDIIQAGHVRAGNVALWYSRAADIWNDYRAPLGAGKRTLYVAIRQTGAPLDIVDEEDAAKGTLAGYKVLYLTDPHVSLPASKAIAAWVAKGGCLFATAGAGMHDEFDRPNPVMEQLLGVRENVLDVSVPAGGVAINLEKEDLPFAKPAATITWSSDASTDSPLPANGTMDAYGAVSHAALDGAAALAKFADGSPAVTYLRNSAGGQAIYCAFEPGLTYFKPAIPLRPVDRGSTDDSMAHFIPTDFDPAAQALITWPTTALPRPAACSTRLVQASIIDSRQGVAIPLVNWSKGPIRGLRVTLTGNFPSQATSASGKKVDDDILGGKRVLTLDLDVADAIILR